MITPAFLAELDRFRTETKRHIHSMFAGEQETEEQGDGLTFADYRRYAPGDDTRLVDWRVYARTGELYVKQFEAERNFTVHVLVDASGSMDFGEDEANKFDVAAKLGLGFAYLTAAEYNDFRFAIFSDTSDRIDAGTSSHGEVLDLIERCNAVDPSGEARFETALSEYAGMIRSRSLVVVVSDFLADVDAIDAGLEALSRNEIILAHVVAPEEREPPAQGDTVFQSLEQEREYRSYFGGRMKQTYQARLGEHMDTVAERSQDLGARHEVVETDEEFFDAFSRVWIG